MNFSRGLVFAAALLGAAIAASAASMAADGMSPPASSLLQLAEAGQQATSAVTEQQRAEIKSAIETIDPDSVRQAALDIANFIDQYAHGVASEGPEQKARVEARVHRAVKLWRKEHANKADRHDLEALLLKLAALGVPVEDAIVPAVQHARELAATRSTAPRAPVLSADQKARLDSALETISPAEVKQAALDIVTGVEQYIYGVKMKGTEQQKDRLKLRIHRALKVWEKDHAGTADRRDLEDLLIKFAALGVSVDDAIIPAVQHAREAAATRSNSPPAIVVSDDQRAQIKAQVQKLTPEDLAQAAESIVIGIDRAIQIEASTATTPQQKQQLELRIHRTFKEWKTIHARTDRDGLVELLVKLAAVGVPVDMIIPAVQQEQIREAVQRLPAQDPKQMAEGIVVGVDRALSIEKSSISTPEQQAQFDAQIRRTIKYWQAKHADKADRDDLTQLLVKLASLGVSVDDVIIPAVQHEREAAATRSASPPPAAADHPAAPVIIERHR